jgi:CheY-like chemotaxis protein
MLPAAEAKGVRIQSVIEPVTDAVNGDPARLQQIVWNLVSNAVKFTPRGGRVQIVVARVDSHVEIRVSDTGEGITPDFLPRIFERFSQADSSATRRHGGLGIGLALVKQLVELHGGRVRAASDGPGLGATFVIELPVAVLSRGESLYLRQHPTAPAPAPSLYAPVPLRGARLLLVDDEPDALELLKEVLEQCEADVSVARSTDEALALLRERSFDVIVSDVGMPDRNGYELIMEARKGGVRTPALALTAFARPEDRTKALVAGYQAHVSKPIDTAELLATIASLLERAVGPAAPR